MKVYYDITCARCGANASYAGVAPEIIREIAAVHCCADGRKGNNSEPVRRVVLGPGERTRSDEEKVRV